MLPIINKGKYNDPRARSISKLSSTERSESGDDQKYIQKKVKGKRKSKVKKVVDDPKNEKIYMK